MMNQFMNEPGCIFMATSRNIIEEYNWCKDIKHVAKVYDISTNEVKDVLKQAGIKVRKPRVRKTDPLHDVGMSERDFYAERD